MGQAAGSQPTRILHDALSKLEAVGQIITQYFRARDFVMCERKGAATELLEL